MAKSKVAKPVPKPPEGAKTVIEMRKVIAERKESLSKRKASATKDGKLNKYDPKFRSATKRLKRAQRKLISEGWRLQYKGKPKEVVAAAPAAAAPAEEAK